MEENPYQTPTANVDPAATGDVAGAEAIRKEHINHEASLRSIGLLYYLGGVVTVLGAFAMTFALFAPAGEAEAGFSIGLGFLLLILGALQLWVGRGFRILRSNIKIPATLLSILGLLNFPVGTMINGYILYLIYSAKGTMILSSEYQQIVAATPHVKYRTSILIWILLAIVVFGLLAAIVIPALN